MKLLYILIQVDTTVSITIGILSIFVPASDQQPEQYKSQDNEHTQYTNTKKVEGNVCLRIRLDVNEERVACEILVTQWPSEVGGDHNVWMVPQFGNSIAIVHTTSIRCSS